jgi:hypothetical protein
MNSGAQCFLGGLTDGGYNLSNSTDCGFNASTSKSGVANLGLDPKGLQDNTGPTQTIGLVAGSPAIDAIPVGTNSCGASGDADQRGVSRPQGSACDIGAFELIPPDNTAPTITITTPAKGATYLLGQVVNADYSCTDAESRVTQCAGSVANGAVLATSAVGSKSFKVTATSSGGTGSATNTYTVTYGFSGFSSPVAGGTTINTAKAGQTIPLKWRVLDANGAPVTNLGSVTVTVASLACTAGVSNDATQETASGGSGLQNLGNGYYQYNWSTPKSYANSCKTLQLNLGEGSPHTALFQFK